MQNEFFMTREGSAANRNEQIHFATNLKRTLTLDEAKRLRDTLSALLDDGPKKPSTADLDAVEGEKKTAADTAAPKGSIWGKGKNAK
jgi:hypothetical protein